MKKSLYITLSLRNSILMTVTFVLFSTSIILMRHVGLSAATALSLSNTPVIIIDAGHGGEDGGTQSKKGVLEKDINLAISLEVCDILSEQGYQTVLTRDGDYLIYDEESKTMREKKASDIHNRMDIMNSYANCIFLSIHQNYFTESKYSGAQVFYSKNNPESEKIASAIQSAVREDLQPDNTRQIKISGTEIYLLYHAKAPAVMVECGFLSNEQEAEKLSDETYRKEMAKSIVRGLTNYLNSKNTETKTQGESENGSKIENSLCVQ